MWQYIRQLGLRATLNLALIIAAALASIPIADWLVELVRRSNGNWPGITPEQLATTLGIGTLIALVKDIALALTVAIQTFWRRLTQYQWLDAVKVFFALLGFWLTMAFLKSSFTPEPVVFRPHPTVVALRDDTSVVLPVYFPNAGRGKTNASAQACAYKEWTQGACLADVDKVTADVRNIVSRCSNWGAITISVTGYASSKEFDNAAESKSQDLNRQLSNDRASYVYGKLLDALNADINLGRVILHKPREYETYDDMIAKRPSIDRTGNANWDKLSEETNRRANIMFQTGGSCSPIEVIKASSAPA